MQDILSQSYFKPYILNIPSSHTFSDYSLMPLKDACILQSTFYYRHILLSILVKIKDIFSYTYVPIKGQSSRFSWKKKNLKKSNKLIFQKDYKLLS